MTNEAEKRFCTDFPGEKGNDLLTEICEAAWAGTGGPESASIISVITQDALNIEVSGIVQLPEGERHFLLRDGNRSGTVILEWGEGPGAGPEPAEPLEPAPLFHPVRASPKAPHPGDRRAPESEQEEERP